MKTVEEFVNALPNLVNDQEELDAIFVTYNSVNGYPAGRVNTEKAGLNIVVRSGNLEYSPMTLLALGAGIALADTELANSGSDRMEHEAHTALANVKDRTKEELAKLENKSFLAVIYAGLSAFTKSLDYAREVRKSHPTAKVFVLTCDCDIRTKAPILDAAITCGEINDAIITSKCGGYDSMRKILEKLVTTWPTNLA